MSRPDFSEDELRAIEEEMDKLSVDDVLLQTLVTLINLGARKAGLSAPPGDDGPQRDLGETRMAIEGARALLPLLEARHGAELAPVKDALARLQMAFVQLAGPAAPAPAAEKPPEPGTGPAQSSGRLWVPGQ
jgi:hypothetical protein